MAYLAASLVMLYPISNVLHLASASYPGDARLNIWTLAWVNHVWESQGLSLFDANIYHPAKGTLAYSEHLVGIAPFSFPIYAATHNPTLAYNIVWFVAFVLNGLMAHLLLFRVTRNHLAALAGGTAYAFSFFNMLHGHGHLQLVWSFWMPLSVIAIDRWAARPSWVRAITVAAVLVMQMLASWYLAVLVLLLAAAYVPFAAFLHRPTRHTIGRLAVQSLAIACVLLLCVAPFVRHYVGFPPGSIAEAAGFSADFASYLVPPQGTWLGLSWPSWMPDQPREPYRESTLFVGYIRLVLFGIGLLWVLGKGPGPAPDRTMRATGAFAVFLVVAGGWLSFGPGRDVLGLPSLYDVFVTLPGMTLIRAPGRFALLVSLGMAIGSAIGALAVLRRWPNATRYVVLLLILGLSETYFVHFPGGRPQPEAIPKVYEFLRDLGPGAVVSLPSHRGLPWDWRDADYQYFSTVHWRPIVNGYSRREPDGYSSVAKLMAAFPGHESATAMRSMGVGFVVVHTEHYEGGALGLIEKAEASPDFALVARDGPQMLFAVRPGR
ncbi:MAG: hypothetical protein HOP16_07935 [Acidobacteria bacterium]|nr:hypothetical protein [Acidobacteriota bacterium]